MFTIFKLIINGGLRLDDQRYGRWLFAFGGLITSLYNAPTLFAAEKETQAYHAKLLQVAKNPLALSSLCRIYLFQQQRVMADILTFHMRFATSAKLPLEKKADKQFVREQTLVQRMHANDIQYALNNADLLLEKEEFLRKKLEQNPSDPFWAALLGSIYVHWEIWPLSSAMYGYCIRLNPENAEWLKRGLHAFFECQLFRQGLEIIERYGTPHIDQPFLGEMWMAFSQKSGAYQRGLKKLYAWTRQNPGNSSHWFHAGILEYKKQSWTKAYRNFAQTIARQKNHPKAHLYLSMIALKKKEEKEAASWLLQYKNLTNEQRFLESLTQAEFSPLIDVLNLLP